MKRTVRARTLDLVLFDVCRGGAGDRFRAAPVEFSRDYGVDPSDIEALTAGDLRSLYDAGAHPMLLMYFSYFLGYDLPGYLRAIGAEAADFMGGHHYRPSEATDTTEQP